MNEKIISAVYGTLSVTVWGATVALLIFIIVIFCTGQYRSPVIEMEEIRLCAAQENDVVLQEHTNNTAGWYKAEYDVCVTGSSFSPYSYTVNNVVLNTPADGQSAADYYFLCEDEIEYAAFTTDEFTLTLYMQCASAEQAKEVASHADFGFRGLKQHFGILYKDIVMHLPGFSAAQYDIEPQFI